MGQETKLKGYKVPHESGSALPSNFAKVKAEFRPGSFRSGTEQEAEVAVLDDEIVEVEFEDGLRIWLTAAEYREKLEKTKKRAPGASGPLEIPDMLPFGGEEAGERGIAGWVMKSLKIVGIDVAGKTAVKLAQTFEEKTDGRKRPGPGVYLCRMSSGDFALEDLPAGRRIEKPVLVFLHGTASSTWGSFGELWSPARSGNLAGLKQRYGDRVIALEHRTMTEGPIANAIEIANALDAHLADGVEVDLVSHSRGGLIGELLCRMNIADGSDPYEALDYKLVTDGAWLGDDPDLTEGEIAAARGALEADGERLKTLAATLGRLAARKVRVRRFVRVACPALGTSLVSRRLDRWVQILANVGRFASSGSPLGELVDSLGDFITAVIKEHTAPSKLPGIVAMLPETGIVRMVNNPRRTVASELAVIAGDSEPEGIWKRLLMLVADRFYAGEHDLVVNTGSMYGGARRETGRSALCFQQGAQVNHFNYFKNSESADAIVTALADADFATLSTRGVGFEPLRPAEKPIAREASRGPAGPRPVVFVLPGIMGSELEVNGNRVWIDFRDLFAGGLAQLHIGATGVTPLRPYAGYYADLIEFLADTHKVIAFPFDWRLRPEQEADRFAQELSRAIAEAKAASQPVRIVAHSMGGLIARTMIARHPEVWREMTSVPGARFVMLGTPNGGSYSINELVVGQAGTLRKLALLDVTHSHAELLAVIARFPGVLAMLPRSDRRRLLRRGHMAEIRRWRKSGVGAARFLRSRPGARIPRHARFESDRLRADDLRRRSGAARPSWECSARTEKSASGQRHAATARCSGKPAYPRNCARGMRPTSPTAICRRKPRSSRQSSISCSGERPHASRATSRSAAKRPVSSWSSLRRRRACPMSARSPPPSSAHRLRVRANASAGRRCSMSESSTAICASRTTLCSSGTTRGTRSSAPNRISTRISMAGCADAIASDSIPAISAPTRWR